MEGRWILHEESLKDTHTHTHRPYFFSIRTMSFPCGSAGKESACNAGDLSLIPGLGRSPGEGKGLPTPVFWPGEFHELYSPWGHKESDTTEWLSLFTATGPVAGANILWVDGGAFLFDWVPQEHSHPFHIQKGKSKSANRDAQGQVDSSYSPLRLWRICLLVLSIKLDQDCYCLVKHTEIWP